MRPASIRIAPIERLATWFGVASLLENAETMVEKLFSRGMIAISLGG